MRHRIALGALVALGALTSTAAAWAHANVSPAVAFLSARLTVTSTSSSTPAGRPVASP